MIQLKGCMSVLGVHTADGELFVCLLLICLHGIQSPYFDNACALSRLQVQVEPNGTNAELSVGESSVLLGQAL